MSLYQMSKKQYFHYLSFWSFFAEQAGGGVESHSGLRPEFWQQEPPSSSPAVATGQIRKGLSSLQLTELLELSAAVTPGLAGLWEVWLIVGGICDVTTLTTVAPRVR